MCSKILGSRNDIKPIDWTVLIVIVTLFSTIIYIALGHGNKKEKDIQRLEKLLDPANLTSAKPTELGNGWYYVGTNAIDSLYRNPPLGLSNISSVCVFTPKVLNRSETGIEGTALISWVSNHLDITNGNFVHVEFCTAKSGKEQLEKVR